MCVCVLHLSYLCPSPGENCNRGAALGALLGAGGSYIGAVIPQDWKDELRDAQDVMAAMMKEADTHRRGGETHT